MINEKLKKLQGKQERGGKKKKMGWGGRNEEEFTPLSIYFCMAFNHNNVSDTPK